MQDNISNNKRIAKNTLILYFRMGITMLVSLYTSRVVLAALGVDDYGIYGIVGGVVSMFAFINSSMASATQRFISYELGNNNYSRLHTVFNNSMLIHIVIAILIVIVCETLGLWFLRHKLIIPSERLYAAEWCFQFSIITAVISIISVPYNALIIAHEKMQAFAYISILEVIIKLLIAYSLMLVSFDKLIIYSFLQLVAQFIIRLIYRQYCKKHFQESNFQLKFDKANFKEMASFAGYDLYGNLSVTLRSQGVNILLNMFFGPVLNAASSIATQIQGTVMSFANNIILAVRPQIIKSYSSQNYSRVIYLIEKSSLICFILLSMLSMPIIVEAPFILHLWLGTVPEYTVSFCRLTLLFGLFANLSQIVMVGIHSTGNIKRPSFINGTLYLLVIPFSYFAYKLGYSPNFAFIFNTAAVFIGLLSNIWTLHLYFPDFSFVAYVKKVILKIILILIVYSCSLCFISLLVERNIFSLIVTCMVSIILSILFILLILNRGERKLVMNKIFKNK